MKRQKVNAKQLAFEIDGSHSALLDNLNGIKEPGYLKLERIAKALNITVSELLA